MGSGGGCGGDDSNSGNNDDNDSGCGDGKSDGDGNRRRLMDSMVKVCLCWPLARGWRQVTNLGGSPRQGGSFGQKC